MSVLHKILEIDTRVDVNNNGSIVSDVMVQILKVVFSETELPDPCKHSLLIFVVKFLVLSVHVQDRFNLEVGASFERRIFLFVEKLKTFFAGFGMNLAILPCHFLIAKSANHCATCVFHLTLTFLVSVFS